MDEIIDECMDMDDYNPEEATSYPSIYIRRAHLSRSR